MFSIIVVFTLAFVAVIAAVAMELLGSSLLRTFPFLPRLLLLGTMTASIGFGSGTGSSMIGVYSTTGGGGC